MFEVRQRSVAPLGARQLAMHITPIILGTMAERKEVGYQAEVTYHSVCVCGESVVIIRRLCKVLLISNQAWQRRTPLYDSCLSHESNRFKPRPSARSPKNSLPLGTGSKLFGPNIVRVRKLQELRILLHGALNRDILLILQVDSIVFVGSSYTGSLWDETGTKIGPYDGVLSSALYHTHCNPSLPISATVLSILSIPGHSLITNT